MVVQKGEAPGHTRLWKTSGALSFGQVARDARGRKFLSSFGFEGGYINIFVQDGFTLNDQPKAPPDALFIASSAGLYKDAGGASRWVRLRVQTAERRGNVRTRSLSGLGSYARAIQATLRGQTFLSIFWIEGNIELEVIIQGPMRFVVARSLAETVDARARRFIANEGM